jgi:rRNA maturation endonuclease Nob1
MQKEHIGTGTKVPPGVYRCNACANEIESAKVDEKLPLCSACGSSSWRTRRLTERPAKK